MHIYTSTHTADILHFSEGSEFFYINKITLKINSNFLKNAIQNLVATPPIEETSLYIYHSTYFPLSVVALLSATVEQPVDYSTHNKNWRKQYTVLQQCYCRASARKNNMAAKKDFFCWVVVNIPRHRPSR